MARRRRAWGPLPDPGPDWGDEDEDPATLAPPWWHHERPVPEVEVGDNPVVAVLYDAQGEVLLEVTERDELPFGFQAPT